MIHKARLQALSGRAEASVRLDLDALVACRQFARQPIPLPRKKVRTHLVGGHLSRFRGRGMDFDEVRHYQPGDDVRTIDWRVTARTGRVHTKIFQEERERPVFLVIDLNDGMFFGSRKRLKSVLAALLAARCLWSALGTGNRVGAMIFSADQHLEIKPSSRRKDGLRLLNTLTEWHNRRLDELYSDGHRGFDRGAGSFAHALERLRHVAKPGSLHYWFSDFSDFDDNCQRHCARLARHNDIHGVQIFDPLEQELPARGHYTVTDGANRLSMDTGDRKLRETYQQAFRERSRQLADYFLSQQAELTSLETGIDLGDVVLQDRSGSLAASGGLP